MFGSLWGKSEKAMHRPRGSERFSVAGLSCPLGDVVDLSASGMRVRFTGAPSLSKGTTATVAVCNDGQCVKVTARVVWVRRAGLMRPGEMGLQWVNVRPGVAAALVQLGRFGFISTDAGTAGATQATPPPPPPSGAAAGQSASGAGVTARVEIEDLYAMLGVTRGASEEVLRRAYHAAAQLLHPDRNPSPQAAAQFAEVSKAWKVLRTPELREKYDALLDRCAGKTAA